VIRNLYNLTLLLLLMKKPLKVAAWSGLLVLIICFVSFILARFSDLELIPFLSNLLIGLFGVFFFYGFVSLGRKFNVKLLRVMAWIGVVLSILVIILGVVSYILPMVDAQIYRDVGYYQGVDEFGTADWISWIVFSVLAGAFFILFGIGIRRLGPGVSYSKVTGVLNIISGITFIIIIGFFVKLVAFVFEIALLFKAAKKSEGMRRAAIGGIKKAVAAPKVVKPVARQKKPIMRPRRAKPVRRAYGKV